MENYLLEKVIELSREVGELKKENEMLKIANNILEDKLNYKLNKNAFSQEELNVLISTIDLLFNIDKIVSDGKRIKHGREKIYEND